MQFWQQADSGKPALTHENIPRAAQTLSHICICLLFQRPGTMGQVTGHRSNRAKVQRDRETAVPALAPVGVNTGLLDKWLLLTLHSS